MAENVWDAATQVSPNVWDEAAKPVKKPNVWDQTAEAGAGYLDKALAMVPETPFWKNDPNAGAYDNALRLFEGMIGPGGPALQTARAALPKLVLGKQLGKPYADVISPEEQEERKPNNVLTKGLDLLQRGQYFSATFADQVATGGVKNLGNALIMAKNEALHPKARTSYSDVIKHVAPDFAKANPVVTEGLGLLGDIYLDPITHFGKVARLLEIPTEAGKKLASKAGMEALKSVRSAILSETLRGIDETAPTILERTGLAKKTAFVREAAKKAEPLMTKFEQPEMAQMGLMGEPSPSKIGIQFDANRAYDIATK